MNTNNALKALSIVSLLLALWILISNWEQIVCMTNADCRDQQTIEAWNKAYEMDTYGGTTPAETLSLFVEALKKGDIELASKYFLIDEQEGAFSLLSGEFSIPLFLEQIENSTTKTAGEKSTISIVENNKLVADMIIVRQNNGVWKIVEL